MYGEGISKEGDILDLASEANVLEKSGAWFAWKGERIGQGRENAKEFLKTNPDVAVAIERAVLEKHGISRSGENAPAPAGAATGEPAATASAPAAPSNGQASPPTKKTKQETPRA
jgi:recombination protein RecA